MPEAATLPVVPSTSGQPDAALEQLAPNLTPPPGNPRFPEIDGLRALAALSVFLGHTVTGTVSPVAHPRLFLHAAQLSIEGVAIFFVISGFLLYRPFLVARVRSRPLGLPGYARRRITRIVPAYWVALTIFVVAGWAPGVTPHNWWIFYGFGQVYSSTTIGQGIGAAWTLCTEAAFYALLPLLAMALACGPPRRTVRREFLVLGLLALAALSFRWRLRSFADFATLDTLPGMFLWFALGMALAVLSLAAVELGRRGRFAALVQRHGPACWISAAALFVGLEELDHVHLGQWQGVASHLLAGLVAMLVVAPGAFPHPASRPVMLLRRPWLVWLGLVSYAFYLYHTVVIARLDHALHALATGWRWPAVLAGSFAITCLCSAVSYYIVERPAMRWAVRR